MSHFPAEGQGIQVPLLIEGRLILVREASLSSEEPFVFVTRLSAALWLSR